MKPLSLPPPLRTYWTVPYFILLLRFRITLSVFLVPVRGDKELNGAAIMKFHYPFIFKNKVFYVFIPGIYRRSPYLPSLYLLILDQGVESSEVKLFDRGSFSIKLS